MGIKFWGGTPALVVCALQRHQMRCCCGARYGGCHVISALTWSWCGCSRHGCRRQLRVYLPCAMSGSQCVVAPKRILAGFHCAGFHVHRVWRCHRVSLHVDWASEHSPVLGASCCAPTLYMCVCVFAVRSYVYSCKGAFPLRLVLIV